MAALRPRFSITLVMRFDSSADPVIAGARTRRSPSGRVARRCRTSHASPDSRASRPGGPSPCPLAAVVTASSSDFGSELMLPFIPKVCKVWQVGTLGLKSRSGSPDGPADVLGHRQHQSTGPAGVGGTRSGGVAGRRGSKLVTSFPQAAANARSQPVTALTNAKPMAEFLPRGAKLEWHRPRRAHGVRPFHRSVATRQITVKQFRSN